MDAGSVHSCLRQAARGQEELAGLEKPQGRHFGGGFGATRPTNRADCAMSKIAIVFGVMTLALGAVASMHVHASMVQAHVRDSSTGPFNPNLPAEARGGSGP